MANFPTLNNKEDSKKFGFDTEDVGIRSDMEGGYVLTRPRHTRPPRRIFKTGFTGINNTDFNSFMAFWNSYGTYKAFTYIVKTSNNELVNVRFQAKPNFQYVGVGATYLWDINDIILEEV